MRIQKIRNCPVSVYLTKSEDTLAYFKKVYSEVKEVLITEQTTFNEKYLHRDAMYNKQEYEIDYNRHLLVEKLLKIFNS